jgi:hypothetical protein
MQEQSKIWITVMKKGYRILLVTLFALLLPEIANSQDIKKDVHVVKPYKPSVSDANKINVLPEINDTTTFRPSFNYSIVPAKLNTSYELRPISAARMVAEPISRLYKSYLKLGYGNYSTPLLELDISNLRSKNLQYGVLMHHLSSGGKLKLANGDKVFAGYGNNDVSLFGKKIYRRSEWTGNIDFSSKSVYYYGYDADTVRIPPPEKKDIKQNFIRLGAKTEIASIHPDSNHFNYNITARYQYIRDKFENAEHGIHLSAFTERFRRDNLIGANSGVDIYHTTPSIDSSYNAVVMFNPWFSRKSDEWKFVLGFNSYLDLTSGHSKIYLYPRASLQFNIVKNILIPYIGVDGHLETNNYEKIASENPFIIPNLHVKPTDHQIEGYGGLKGKFSSKGTFNLKVSYSIINNAYFFVNDSLSEFGTKFKAVYDDIELVRYFGELGYAYSEKLSFLFRGSLYNYTMFYEEKPWHKPSWEVNLEARYNIQDKIIASAAVNLLSKRWAKPFKAGQPALELSAVPDINLGLEYRYTSILSAFIKFNNLGAARYYQWNQYPSQRFFVMAGFTYLL